MLGWIGFLKRAPSEVFFAGLILDPDTLSAAENPIVAVSSQNIGMARDRSEPTTAIMLGGPMHRVFGTQAGKGAVGHPTAESIVATQI